MKYIEDKKINTLMASIRGKGPVPWRFVVDMYEHAGGTASEFNTLMRGYLERWPDRIIIHHGYNISNGAMIEVTKK